MLPRTLEPEVMDSAAEAAAYEAMDHSVPNNAVVDRLVELGAAGRCLDIGTGPGDIPFRLCERLDHVHVVGVDLAHEMLKLAERRRAALPFADRLSFEHVDAKGLPYDDDTFDTVFSNTILHHIPDRKPFLTEADRVLKPDGVLLIRDLFRPEDEATVEAQVARHAANEPPDSQQLLRQSLHAAFTPDELRDLVRQCGLADVEVVIDTDRHVSIQRRRSI